MTSADIKEQIRLVRKDQEETLFLFGKHCYMNGLDTSSVYAGKTDEQSLEFIQDVKRMTDHFYKTLELINQKLIQLDEDLAAAETCEENDKIIRSINTTNN